MKKDLWQLIDEADAHNYDNIATKLKQDMEKSEATADMSAETVRCDSGKASENLYEKIDQFSQAEQERESSEQDIMDASDKTVTSFQQASTFLQTEYEKLVERGRQFQREMEQIKNIMEKMQEQIKRRSPENLQKLMTNGKKFVSDIENLREDIRWQKPVIAATLWKEAREQVSQVYTGIREIPNKVKIAVRNKAYNIVDQAVQKTSSVFDKGIQYLQSKKEDILNLSPLEKKRQAAEKAKEEIKTVEQQQPSVQHANKASKDRTVISVQDKAFDDRSCINKPRKMLLRVEAKENVRSQAHEKERSL